MSPTVRFSHLDSGQVTVASEALVEVAAGYEVSARHPVTAWSARVRCGRVRGVAEPPSISWSFAGHCRVTAPLWIIDGDFVP